MYFLSHILTGVAVGVVISETTGTDPRITVPACIVFSIAPDSNLFWKKITEHHRDFTHYPIFWLLTAVVVFLAEYFLGLSSFIFTLSLLASTIVHLLLDTFGISLGVHWLAPFSYREFSFTDLDKSGLDRTPKEKAVSFFKSGHFLYELGTIAIAILIVLAII